MSDLSSLPPTVRATEEDFVDRSEFWFRTPGDERANSFWEMDEPGKPYLYTASDIVKFTEANCLAAVAPENHELLQEFKKKIRADWDANSKSPKVLNDLAHLLSEYMVWIDRLFYFGILTGPTRKDGKLVSGKEKFRFAAEEGLTNGMSGEVLNGLFLKGRGELWVNLLLPSGPVHFADGLCVVVHESVHIYLHLLTRDRSASNYFKEVCQDNGHGVEFQQLLQFIFSQLFDWMPAMPILRELATDTLENFRVALSKPSFSEAEARAQIYDFVV
ncbi:hypothetical protein O1611_g1528 [Lasiodiplodia mahajangana]|uniref:Uncharacterized protein n=1 Tax=Lasiodiplodia mahajangana TaxID=1108764 RepID=A0ACC2JX66_9PEZI|nr:hypothetical protein O1611_g1528 [Lasiodiplodia mahajangana]